MKTRKLSFGQWLQAQIDAKGWKQADLVRHSKLSKNYISRLVADRSTTDGMKPSQPSREACGRIAIALGVDPAIVEDAAGWKPDGLSIENAGPGERIWYDAMFYKEQQLTDDERRKRIEVLKETLEAELDRQLQEEAREKGRK